MKNERYYYSIMEPFEREAYKKIYEGIKAYALNILITLPLTKEKIEKIYRKVLFDNPLFFYINQTVIKMRYCPGEFILMPEYIFRISESEAITRDIRKVVNKVSTSAQKYSGNEFRLEKYFHDSMVKSIVYDHDALTAKDKYNAFSVVGAFLDKTAVCEGIAKAFKVLCNEHAIKCIVALGKASPDRIYDEESYHAWNLVKINGESYHVDVTWDNRYHDEGAEHISYDYFNLTTSEILIDHQPEDVLPLCTSEKLNYFTCTDSNVSTFEELCRLIRNRRHLKMIVFRMLNDKGEFSTEEEMHEKVIYAAERELEDIIKTGNVKIAFNELHRIGKIKIK